MESIRYSLARSLGIRVEKYRTGSGMEETGSAEWKTVGGARALIDTETGSILAGCPGLEGEDLDDLGEDEEPEHRERRERKQEAAEAAGHEPHRQQRARAEWDQAEAEAPDADVVIVRVGDDYWAFGPSAQAIKEWGEIGDGEVAEFAKGSFDSLIGELSVSAGLRVAVAEPGDWGLKTFSDDMPDEHEREQIEEHAAWERAGKPKKRKLSEFDRQIAEYTGENPDDIAELKNAVNFTWKKLQTEVGAENDALRQLLGTFATGKGAAGGMASVISRAKDPDQVKGFDQVVEYAQAHYPHLLEGNTRAESGWNPEYALFQRIKRGIRKPPARDSEEVFREAATMLKHGYVPEETSHRWGYSATSAKKWRKILYKSDIAKAAKMRKIPAVNRAPEGIACQR